MLALENTYARDLADGFSVPWRPQAAPSPKSLFFNAELADELRLDAAALAGPAAASLLAGSVVPEGAQPIAQAYAGHQFGGFSPQLGDGRAVLLGEVVDRGGVRRDIALKGSGRTPFSRGGDGKAAVGPMLREALIGEAMHALGIPTTRALAVVATGEPVYREAVLPGAVLTRVAASHIRVGTFQFFAARGDVERVRRLAEYTIARHDPDLVASPGRFLALLERVVARQAKLVAQWLNVGFIHGVMNTDNMTISGETIDYGPCAFVEAYDPKAVFSSIDTQGRYAFGNQPAVALWNLARLAETLLPLIADDAEEAAERASGVLEGYAPAHRRALVDGQRLKLGLRAAPADADLDDDADLAAAFLSLLHAAGADHTLGWRHLADASDPARGGASPLRALLGAASAGLDPWLDRWRARCAADDLDAPGSDADRAAARAARMRRANPLVVPRNHRVEEALAAASDNADLGPFDRLLAAVRRPFDDAPDLAPYAEPAPAEVTAGYRTYCGT